jgi:hypothetical protein
MKQAALYAVALGTGLFAPVLVRAQEGRHIEVSVGGIVASARSRVFLADTLEAVGGRWLGGVVGVKSGRVSASLTGLRGTLSPIANTPFERDAGQLDAAVRFEPRNWLDLEAKYSVRAFRSASLYQRWTMLGAGVRFWGAVVDSAVRVYLGASYVPFVSAGVQASAQHGLGAEAGVSANLAHWTVALSYHFERYDFAGGASARLEEFDWIGLHVSYRIPWPRKAAP